MATNSLNGRVVLITGGSRGIGQALVSRLADAGATLAFTYFSSQAPAKELEEKLLAQGHKAKAYQSDATSYDQAEALVKAVVNDFSRLDVLINNAGITKDNLLLRMSEADWDTVQAANLKSCFNTTRHASRQFLRQRSGVVINISSVVGQAGNPGQANYVASKAGIIGMTKSVAQELGAIGVRCNAVAPGFIETEMTDKLDAKVREEYLKKIPLQRFGKVEEIADTCIFLASDASAYITGQVLGVNGGMY